MIYGKLAAGGLLIASIALGGYAMAQQSGPTATPGIAASGPAQPTLSVPDVTARVAAQGYTDIAAVERKGDTRYEVKARDPQGRRRELYVDARTGEILKHEREDD